MDPLDELTQHFPEIIAEMPNRFSSHEFIRKLAQRHQPLYVQVLAKYIHQPQVSPFQIAHGVLAKKLYSFDTLIRKIGEEPSENIFGEISTASVWGKIKEHS